MLEEGGAQKVSVWRRGFNILRWPLVFSALALSLVLFVVGLLNSIGYQGTTNLRKTKDSPEWQNLMNSEGGERGKPFVWKGDTKPTMADGVAMFDTRLVSVLGYLKNTKTGENCGWKNGHERLKLDINSSEYSDLTVPPWKTVPPSTLYRGVGLRIVEADYIKCTIEPVADPKYCPEAPQPMAFKGADGQIKKPIPLTDPTVSSLSPDPHPPGCKVTCAVDYYPNNPTDVVDAIDKTEPFYSTTLTSLVRPIGTFPIESIKEKGAEASVFKAAQLVIELMNTDEPGCENPKGNSGFQRLIPITLITPNWIVKELGDSWQTMRTAAKAKFPFNFQPGSPLAGLSMDPLLDRKGLHLNY